MGLFSWLFQHDQREEEREVADRYASPLAHDWRDLGPIRRPVDHSAGFQDDLTLHRTGPTASSGSVMDLGLGGDDHWAAYQRPAINPATGLPMLNEVFDIHHNHFGVSEDIGGMDSLTGMDGGIDSFGDMGGCDGRW
jgi:hypothetical protein